MRTTRWFFTWVILLCLILTMSSAEISFIPDDQVVKIKKQHCFGYTIIEAGTGIDCYGDTVKLVRSRGFYITAAQ